MSLQGMSLKERIHQKLEEYFLWRDRLRLLDWSSLEQEPSVEEANRFLKGLGDRFTRLRWVSTASENLTDYLGVGMLLWPRFGAFSPSALAEDCLPVTNREGYPLLRWIFPSSPAMESGLCTGDALCSVNGRSVVGVSLSEVAAFLQPDKDPTTPLHLEVIPSDSGKTRSLSLLPRKVEIPLALTQQVAGIDYIHLPRCDLERASSQFPEILASLTGWAVIWDLRGFKGCNLPIVQRLAAPMLSADQIIFRRVHFDKGRETTTEILSPGYVHGGFSKPLMILINHNTQSGGEQLVGAFQYHKCATHIGTDTGGKGVSQFRLHLGERNGQRLELSITEGKFFTPDNRWPGDGNAERIRLKPDRRVEQPISNAMPAMEGDAQYDWAMQFLLHSQASC